jgi:hypothetical protein
MKPKYELADIFRGYGDEYRKSHAMTDDQRKTVAAILACRTAQLGGHQEVCDRCGNKKLLKFLPQPPLPEVSDHNQRTMAGKSPGRASALRLFPYGVHRAA